MSDLRQEVWAAVSLPANATESTQQFVKSVINRLSQLGRLDVSDVGALTILATEYEKITRINDLFATGQEDYLVEGKRNPLLMIVNNAEQICISVMKEFGLTARSRKNLNERLPRTGQTNDICQEFD